MARNAARVFWSQLCALAQVARGCLKLRLLAVVMLAISMQFFLMGLLAELLVRTYHESQDKSIYAVRERIGF